MPDDAVLDREVAALVDLAATSIDRTSFRADALRRLRALIAFDNGVFCSRAAEPPATLETPTDHATRFVSNFDRYVDELRPIERAALASGGVIVDAQVLSPRQRSRMRFYAEIVRPQGIGALLAGYLTLRGAPIAAIYLARRRGRPAFRRAECERLRRLLPALSVGDAAHAPPAAIRAAENVDWSPLSPRERELVEYVALGLRNDDIALACGTSSNTIRNQLASVFAKMCVANRTELTRLAVSSGLATVAKGG